MNINRIATRIAVGTLFGASMLLSGCQSAMQVGSLVGVPQDTVAKTSNKAYTPTNANNVHVYLSGESISKPYETLGKVSVDQYAYMINRSEETKLAMLREKAASLGGNGVIDLHDGMTAVTGTVIRVKDKA